MVVITRSNADLNSSSVFENMSSFFGTTPKRNDNFLESENKENEEDLENIQSTLSNVIETQMAMVFEKLETKLVSKFNNILDQISIPSRHSTPSIRSIFTPSPSILASNQSSSSQNDVLKLLPPMSETSKRVFPIFDGDANSFDRWKAKFTRRN